jgi:hypothetical protein
MARQYRVWQWLKLIAGVGLIGLGLFVLCGSLADAADRLSRLVGVRTEWAQVFGGLMAVGLTVLRVWQCYVFDRRELVLGVCRILISFWPMCLVIAGAVLTGTASRADAKNSQKNIPDMSN